MSGLPTSWMPWKATRSAFWTRSASRRRGTAEPTFGVRIRSTGARPTGAGIDEPARHSATCSHGDSIFDVVRKCECLGDERDGFEAAKIRVAETIGRADLIRKRRNGVR